MVFDPRPISVNDMYSTARGRRFLTKAGKHYKDAIRETTSKTLIQLCDPTWKEVIDAIYKTGGQVYLGLQLCLDDLWNASWKPGGSLTASGAIRSPYRKVDVSNYFKLIEDAVAEATGIDDSTHTHTEQEKLPHDEPHVIINYKVYCNG